MPGLITVLVINMFMCDGTDVISSETKVRPRLESTWEGTCQGWPGAKGETLKIRLEPGFLILYQGKDGIVYNWKWIDEGKGKLKVKGIRGQISALGIYKWKRDRLVICFRDVEKGHPRKFYAGKGQVLLLLKHVQKDR